MQFFRIKNYEVYQSKKKDRNSLPWIKLHKKLMNDWAYGELRVSERLMFIHMLLMADSVSNRFPVDAKWMRTKLQVDAKWIFTSFESKGLVEIIGCKQEQENPSRIEDINLKDINLKENKKKKTIPPSKDLEKKILARLNFEADKNFMNTDSNLKFISGRLADGHTEEDFYKVISTQVKEWKDVTKMNVYLRPQTIFCAKNFDGYLNAKDSDPLSWAKEAEESEKMFNELIGGKDGHPEV